MDLLSTPDNPAPPGGRILTIRTHDNVALRVAAWPARNDRSRGTVVIAQGRAEFIEKYFEVVEDLLRRGFAVVTFDWRGQGRSGRTLADGRKGHVRHFDDFRHDFEAVIKQALGPPLGGPLYVLGHSMGGCVALIGAAEGWLRPDRLIVTTPMIALSIVRHHRLTRAIARFLDFVGLGGRFVPGGRAESISMEPFAGNRLSRDEHRYQRNAVLAGLMGEGAIGSPTIGWLRAAYEAMDKLQASGFARAISVPTLLVGAGDDPVCSTAVSETFARALGPGSAFLLIPESRHEVLMESDAIRASFWEAFDAFMPPPSASGSPPQTFDHPLMEPLVTAGDDIAAARR